MNIHERREGEVFVFGSNLSGIHGAGAARDALEKYGAEWGVGTGLQGDSYAIPTKDWRIETLSLDVIQIHVETFKDFARSWPDMKFFVTRIGCGLAGYTDAEISPLFDGAPDNCRLPPGWRK